MPKNIILLSDGTGNSASKLFKTNVWRLYQALDLEELRETDGLTQQVAYYDDGVGTASLKPLALIGGAFGWGLKRNVLDLYTALCRHYEPGDNIYCFGFSRGAFTIRVLAGLINNQGLVQTKEDVPIGPRAFLTRLKEFLHIAPSAAPPAKPMGEGKLRWLAAEAFRAYRDERYHEGWELFKWPRRIFRGLRDAVLWVWYEITGRSHYDASLNHQRVTIKFLGLWDTVAAYGLPVDELTKAWDAFFPISFPDRNLNYNVQRACHALALDDERHSFHPELWNEDQQDYETEKYLEKGRERGLPAPRPIGERLTQVWFTGMHTNVGGGYPDDRLAHVPLDWMMTEAEQAGLIFKPDERKRLQELADVNGKMYDSRQGTGGAYRYQPRKLYDLTHDCAKPDNQVLVDQPKIHESVFRRIRNRAEGYAPIGLPERYVVYTAAGQTIAPPVARPDFVEDSSRARNRKNRQEQVWNLVWWKRVFYFLSVIVATLLALFPLYYVPKHDWEKRVEFVATGVGMLGGLLPDYLNTWLDAYQNHPGLFGMLAGLFSLLLFIGSKLQLRIFDRMRTLWEPAAQWQTPLPVVAAAPRDWLFRLREANWYRRFWRVMRERVMPVLATLALAIGLWRAYLYLADSRGHYCKPATNDKSIFSTNDPCWDSGRDVKEGVRYRITISEYAQWIDGKEKNEQDGKLSNFFKPTPIKPPTLSGYSTTALSPLAYGSYFFRRHLRAPWFSPIVRIGAKSSDEYPLSLAPPEQQPSAIEIKAPAHQRQLVAEIKARSSSRLYLYLNDAVSPFVGTRLYDNNQGNATVQVEQIIE